MVATVPKIFADLNEELTWNVAHSFSYMWKTATSRPVKNLLCNYKVQVFVTTSGTMTQNKDKKKLLIGFY